MVDAEGQEIGEIAPDREQKALMSDLVMDHEEPFLEQPEQDYLYEGEGDDVLPAGGSLAKPRKGRIPSGDVRPGSTQPKGPRASTSQLQGMISTKQGGLRPGQPDNRAHSALRAAASLGSDLAAVQPKRNQFMAPSASGHSIE